MVGNALVAVDAGLVVLAGHLVGLLGAGSLRLGIHAIEAMAVAALAGVGRLHAGPFVARQFKPLGLEFFLGVDGAHDLSVDLLGGLHLADDLVGPVLGHMAVGTGGAHPGAVGVVDGLLVFLIDVVPHFVARDTEVHLVGRFHGGVEAAPEERCPEIMPVASTPSSE
jgi:hypothetical protein